MDREFGLPELLCLCSLRRHDMFSCFPGDDQVWKVVSGSQSGDVLEDSAGELGEGDGALDDGFHLIEQSINSVVLQSTMHQYPQIP